MVTCLAPASSSGKPESSHCQKSLAESKVANVLSMLRCQVAARRRATVSSSIRSNYAKFTGLRPSTPCNCFEAYKQDIARDPCLEQAKFEVSCHERHHSLRCQLRQESASVQESVQSSPIHFKSKVPGLSARFLGFSSCFLSRSRQEELDVMRKEMREAQRMFVPRKGCLKMSRVSSSRSCARAVISSCIELSDPKIVRAEPTCRLHVHVG